MFWFPELWPLAATVSTDSQLLLYAALSSGISCRLAHYVCCLVSSRETVLFTTALYIFLLPHSCFRKGRNIKIQFLFLRFNSQCKPSMLYFKGPFSYNLLQVDSNTTQLLKYCFILINFAVLPIPPDLWRTIPSSQDSVIHQSGLM